MSKNISYARGLPVGTSCKAADNSGAKVYKIIGVINVNSTKRRVRSATIGDIVTMSVKKGPRTLRKKVLRGIIVRQVKPIFRKAVGYRISFYDNAIVEITKENAVVNTRIKGAIAREAVSKIPLLNGRGGIVL